QGRPILQPFGGFLLRVRFRRRRRDLGGFHCLVRIRQRLGGCGVAGHQFQRRGIVLDRLVVASAGHCRLSGGHQTLILGALTFFLFFLFGFRVLGCLGVRLAFLRVLFQGRQ